jgi:hypothetical protein
MSVEPKLEYALEVRLRLKRPRLEIKPLPVGGARLGVQIEGGEFEGSGLSGIVEPGGGEWPHVREDGVFCFDARYHLICNDGTPIMIQNRGYRHADPATMERLWSLPPGETVPADAYYFRAITLFEVAPGPHDWLSRHVFIGVGERLETGNRVRYFKVT